MKKIKDYTLYYELGKNNCSSCYRGQDTNKKRSVMVKLVNRKLIDSNEALKTHFEKELNFLIDSDNDFGLKLLDYPFTNNNFYLVYEGLGIDFFSKTLETRSIIFESEAIYYLVQIWKGYNFLMLNNRPRRDMTLNNLFKNQGKILIDDLG